VSKRQHEAFVGLGSNLGQREKNIAAALNALQATREIEVAQVSSLYETPAEGGPDHQPDYINAVARVQTTLSPARLLAVCQHIEGSLGRKRTVRWGPRTIDLDLLAYDRRICGDRELTLPHPMMHRRRFVMEPLAEISPNWVHPVLERSAEAILKTIDHDDESACGGPD
jgi:2-amino-4-hydroxy-6-hydroxymethyldihydropteridine diphosphokinase